MNTIAECCYIFRNLMKIVFFYLALIGSISALAQNKDPASTSFKALYNFISLEDSGINKPHKTTFGINTGWETYKDIMFPGTDIEGKAVTKNKFADRKDVLKCRITGGDAYNNIFFTNTLAKQLKTKHWNFTTANAFSYGMDFYVDNNIDCKTPNLSELEGLEFIFQKAMPPYSYLWGLQWSKSNVWSYWDDTRINKKVKGWVRITKINACMKQTDWNTIRITGFQNDNELFYEKLYLNNESFPLNIKVQKSTLPTNFVENYLQVGFQINGNTAIRKGHSNGTDPVNVYLDNINLLTGKKEL